MQTRAQRALTGHGEAAGALLELLGELLTLSGVARHLGEVVAGSDLRYDMPGSSAVQHPLAGRLAPDLRLTTPDGGSTRVAELVRAARPLLLDCTSGGRVAAQVAMQSAGPDQPVPGLVVRAEGGRTAADALLIRPDGIVAWASGPGAAEPAAGLADALRAWFG